MAENIVVDANYVYFDLIGFKIQIPTSSTREVNVDLSWYKKDYGEPTLYLSDHEKLIKKYYEALDSGANWKTLADIRLFNYKE